MIVDLTPDEIILVQFVLSDAIYKELDRLNMSRLEGFRTDHYQASIDALFAIKAKLSGDSV